MDSTAGQNILSRFHSQQQVDRTSAFSPGYWSDVDTLYAAEQNHQLQRQQGPSPPQPEQPPLGIGWDHAVFQQQRPAQALQNQQQLPVQDQNGHSHAHPQGIYVPPPQTWHQSPPQQQARLVSPAPQEFGQYHPSHHYPQQDLGYEARLLNPTESASFPQYAYPQNLYAAPQLAGQDRYSQASSLQPLRRDSYSSQTTSQQPQYAISSDFPEHLRQPQLGFPGDFNGRMSSSSSQQTINPRFLDTPEQVLNQQQAGHQNNQLYFGPTGPTDFKLPDSEKPFQYYRQDGQPASALQQPMEKPQFSIIIPQQGPASAHPINAVDGKKKKKKAPAKKPAQPQTKKTTKAAKKSDGDESDASDLEIVEPEEPSLLPAVRPSDPVAAVEYDTIKAVWSPRNRQPSVDRIKAALNPFKDIVKSIRDTWKDKTQAMQVAENHGDNDKAAALKKEVVFHRRLMDAIVTTALEKGHPRIIENLGQAPLSVIAMYSFLLDRHQASDFDGTLTINILKLLSRLITMDQDTLQKTKVDKLLDRLIRKGGPTVKELAQKILDNAAAATRRKKESTKAVADAGSTVEGTSPDAAATGGNRSPLVGSKRVRDGDANGLPASKKVVVTSSLKNGPKLSPAAHTNVQRSPDPATETKSAAASTAARPKANIIAPKPTSLFGTLASASKRPGTSNAERAAAAALAKASTTEKKASPPPPPPKPAFSLGDIMADLNKQTTPAPTAPVEEKAPETEEERQKRLRKEERRKLRVSWKPEDSLTEVRLFTHDPDEELGPQNGAQAGDVKGEGSVLKLHRDLDELEDDEDALVPEESLSPYRQASEVDFNDLSADDRARNYVKRAGSQPPSSTEKDAQDRREATTLMVFYTSGEVPPSPKEPPPPLPSEAEPAVEEVPFGDIPDHVKARQERYYAFTHAKPAATATAPPTPLAAAPSTNPIDIAGLLKIIQGVSQPPPQQTQNNPMVDLERTFNLFRQQSQPQPQPPSALPQMPQASSIPMPQAPVTSGPDLQQILAAMNVQPQVRQPPVVPQVPQAQPGAAPNLAAIFSQLAQPNQQASTSQHYEDPERKRMRDLAAAGHDGSQEERWQSHKRSRPNFDKPKKPYKVGLVACRYWREGKCLKGDNCTFRHDPLDK